MRQGIFVHVLKIPSSLDLKGTEKMKAEGRRAVETRRQNEFQHLGSKKWAPLWPIGSLIYQRAERRGWI